MASDTLTLVENRRPTTSSSRWFSPNDQQRHWFYLIRVAESFPGVNTFYNLWLDENEPPTKNAIKDLLGCLATVDALLLGALASFVSSMNFDELNEHNLRYTKQVFNNILSHKPPS